MLKIAPVCFSAPLVCLPHHRTSCLPACLQWGKMEAATAPSPAVKPKMDNNLSLVEYELVPVSGEVSAGRRGRAFPWGSASPRCAWKGSRWAGRAKIGNDFLYCQSAHSRP